MVTGSHSCSPNSVSKKVFQEEEVTRPLEKVLESKEEENRTLVQLVTV